MSNIRLLSIVIPFVCVLICAGCGGDTVVTTSGGGDGSNGDQNQSTENSAQNNGFASNTNQGSSSENDGTGGNDGTGDNDGTGNSTPNGHQNASATNNDQDSNGNSDDNQSSSNAAPEHSPSTEPNQVFSDMSGQEVATYCEERREFVETVATDTINEYFCIFEAAFEAALDDGDDPVSVCEQAFAECMSGDPQTEVTECDIQSIDRSDCDATVAQMNACIDEELEEIEQFVNDFSCNLVDEEADEVEDVTDEPGPACQTVYDACPALDN